MLFGPLSVGDGVADATHGALITDDGKTPLPLQSIDSMTQHVSWSERQWSTVLFGRYS